MRINKVKFLLNREKYNKNPLLTKNNHSIERVVVKKFNDDGGHPMIFRLAHMCLPLNLL